MSDAIQFFVPGTPVAQGSKRGFMRGGKVRIVEHSGKAHKRWRALVRHHAEVYLQACRISSIPARVPVSVCLTFALDRPDGHTLRSGALSAVGRRATCPAIRPDIDKLTRAVLDSVTDAGIWHDDSQVCSISATKVYAHETALAGVHVSIARMVGQ